MVNSCAIPGLISAIAATSSQVVSYCTDRPVMHLKNHFVDVNQRFTVHCLLLLQQLYLHDFEPYTIP